MYALRAHDRDLPRVDEEVARLADAEHAPFVLDDRAAERGESLATRVIRVRALRRRMLDLYDRTCALCTLRLLWADSIEAEAAHIKPRALLEADDVRNALALCRTHHWALDEGLWTATDDLVVRVRVQPPGPAGDAYDLRALAEWAGRRRALPARATARPAAEAPRVASGGGVRGGKVGRNAVGVEDRHRS